MVEPAIGGDGSVETDVAQQMIVEASQRFELMAARLRRGADIKHRLAYKRAEATKEEPHAGKVRALPQAKQYAALMQSISARATSSLGPRHSVALIS